MKSKLLSNQRLYLSFVVALAVAFVGACSSSSSSPALSLSSSGSGTEFNGDPPPVTCTAPSRYNVSTPTTTIGDGTAASCTQAKLQAAADVGGIIVFNCGPSATITVSSPIVFKKETVLDGGGSVTLSGGGSSRILYLDSGYDQTTPRLVVQRLSFINGQSARTGDDTSDGGAAIYRDGGSLTVIDCVFLDNRAPQTGPDLAGGAIYAFGGGDTIIVGSTFMGNSASDGGAVGSLNGDLIIINSTFTENAATGSGGNPGNGGCGGAIYMDGADELTSMCGVTIRNNTAGAIGGGFFRVSNYDNGTFTMDRTAVDSNRVTANGKGNAGGLYLQGLDLNIEKSTISRNQAHYNGGIWISESRVKMTNVTIAENTATGSNGGGIWLSYQPAGELLNCTIANNHAGIPGVVNWEAGAGAVFGGHPGLVLKNTLVSSNTGTWGPSCDSPLGDGGGNLQWTETSPCVLRLIADPLLGTLGNNGGPTETMIPAAGSPALSAGTGCPAADQLGNPRSSTTCTSGSVEIP